MNGPDASSGAVHPSRLVEPVIGPRFARTRWLAPPATNGFAVCAGMTGREPDRAASDNRMPGACRSEQCIPRSEQYWPPITRYKLFARPDWQMLRDASRHAQAFVKVGPFSPKFLAAQRVAA